jgi:hypothetical protein
MTEQQPKEPKKKAGSIRQYATLGRGPTKTPERLDVQTSGSQSVQTPKRQDTQESERSDTQAPGHPGEETPRSQSTETLEQTGAKTKRERHTIYLPPELSEWVKIKAIITKQEISELVTKALERYKSEIE